MSRSPTPTRAARRHPWPRVLVRARRTWFEITETLSFLAAAGGAVGRFLIGRWPEPPGEDDLAPGGAALRPAVATAPPPRRRRRRRPIPKAAPRAS